MRTIFILTTLIFSIMLNHSNAQNWLDSNAYPFESNFLATENGKVHYIDEGEGEVILFVHGTPAWSFLYRNYIKALSKNYRCIAIDHLGFGLSEKPEDFEGTPQAHSKNLNHLIEHLNLTNITLVVHDFGGPIGLSYAIEKPENVKQIVLFNTWLWETENDKEAQKVDKILHSKIGNFIYLNTNFSPKFLFKNAFANKKKLNKETHKHYYKPFPNKYSRYGLLKIGKSLVGSSKWYAEQWNKIEQIKDKPVLILWGDEDPFIKEQHLNKWKNTLTNYELHQFEAGHFVQEEAFEESFEKLQNWLAGR